VSARSETEVEAVREMLAPFWRAGYRFFPLGPGSKTPLLAGWQTKSFSDGQLKNWVARGGNLGIALQDEDIILDVDPRNFAPGDDAFKRLCEDVGADLGNAPTVLSGRGDGGRHIYFKQPARLRIRSRLPDYPGIDFKSRSGFMVAPGSRHPLTGRLYEPDGHAPPIADVQLAPRTLLTLLRRPAASRRRQPGEGVGIITPDQLETLLAVLDPRDYGHGKYDTWLRLAAACHDATGGAGLEVWLDWCTGDEAYADQETAERNATIWNSFQAGRAGGVTYRTLFKAVSSSGCGDLLIGLGDGNRAMTIQDFDEPVLTAEDFDSDRPALLSEDFDDTYRNNGGSQTHG